ncbi:MAG: TIGR01212 family radical SAM protein, partial [Muribaculaceae bacterium]|nr:TIGR01212 family radical SAM protein [Muribaculaceae bacterium]
LRGTTLAEKYTAGDSAITLFTPESYVELCVRILEHLRKDIAVDRFVAQAPADLLIAPKWGLKNYEFREILLKRLKK